MISIKNASVIFTGNLNKSFLKGGFLQKTTYNEYALSDINIELHEGDRVAIIGKMDREKLHF